MQFVINREQGGARLDQFLSKMLEGYSRGQVRVLLQDGHVKVNGRVVRVGHRLGEGDSVVVELPHRAAEDVAIPVLFENSALLVVDKPAGIPCAPLAPHDKNNVVSILAERFPDILTAGEAALEGGLLHRLDNETSGVLALARSKESYRSFRTQFSKGETRKTYLALVQGHVLDRGEITAAIVHADAKRMRVAAVDEVGGQPAHTWFRPLGRGHREGRDYSLIEVGLGLGVRHQVRVHMASLGHPLAGDLVYGDPSTRLWPRHFLHASTLQLFHPVSHEPVEFESRLPELLAHWLKDVGIDPLGVF